ncbi:MAG: prepilin-type N-terminal cleavage/methylation domain-containing protein [Candidatus Omnitrophica bacterium]|nr:prepilin-type N-terminal cleavage/methylation domain-containing protein [Candidatus Omnitrophota bacterium]
MRNKGFTLVELIIALGIIIIVFGLVFTTYLTTNRLWRGGFTQTTFQSRGRIALSDISRNIRSSTGATILDNGDRVRFVTDPNRTVGTTSDDVTGLYYLSGTDIIFDPDISVSDDEVSLLRKVYKEPSIPLFQKTGDVVVITFKLYNSDAIYGTHWSSMSTSIKIRNI